MGKLVRIDTLLEIVLVKEFKTRLKSMLIYNTLHFLNPTDSEIF